MASLLDGWWAAIWPNLAASAIWATPAFLLHHRRVLKRLDEHHERLAQSLGTTTAAREAL